MIIDHSEARIITDLEKDVYLAFHTSFNSLELRRWVGGISNTSPHNERLIMCANPKYVFYAQHMSSLDGRGEEADMERQKSRASCHGVQGWRVGIGSDTYGTQR